jgi:hypothetical protein
MSEVSDGVHTSHCCHKHGCKYAVNSGECPVENGTLVQEYPCEFCEMDAQDENETVDQILAWLEAKVTKHFAHADVLEEAGAVEVANTSRTQAGHYQRIARGIKTREWKK